jgi:hypothetical protein
MKQNFDIKAMVRSTRIFLKKVMRFHYVFSLSLIVVGVAFTTYYINNILNNPPIPPGTAPQVGFSDKFDTDTIKKIDKFKYRDETTISPAPSGRTNPFTE